MRNEAHMAATDARRCGVALTARRCEPSADFPDG